MKPLVSIINTPDRIADSLQSAIARPGNARSDGRHSAAICLAGAIIHDNRFLQALAAQLEGCPEEPACAGDTPG